MVPTRRFLRLLFLPLLLVGCFTRISAQVVTGEGPRYPGTTGEAAPVDTFGLREARDRTEDAVGLFEGPIDPDRYVVGPGDELTVSIISTTSRQYPLNVTPDGRLLIPTVGKVDLRGQSLSQAEASIRAGVARVYRAADVSVGLSRMRKFKVHVVGAVNTPGTVVATPTTRVSEAIALAGGPSSQADRRSIVVTHATGGRTTVDLMPFFTVGRRESNPELRDGDVVKVAYEDPKEIVQVLGAVERPGEMTYHDGDSISSLIAYAMGPTADAQLDSVEVVSVDEGGGITGQTWHTLLPDGTVTGDRRVDVGDRVFVRSRQDFRAVNRIVVAGRLKHPGSYPVTPGVTRLRDIIQAAGGFTPDAAIPDAQLFRNRFAREVDFRLATIQLIDPEKRTREQLEYWSQKALERPGRMTVDFAALERGESKENILVMGDDSLFVPELKGFVRVTGKVKNPGALTYLPGKTHEDYIQMAGGYGWRADEGATEIVKAGTGEVFSASSSDNYVLEPGDEIWVPEEKPANLGEVATNVITIVAQVATIIAVILSMRGQ